MLHERRRNVHERPTRRRRNGLRAKAFTSNPHPPQHSTWPGPTVSSILCMLSLKYAEQLFGVASGSGFHPHLPGFKYKFLSTAMGATMWFFIFYRARCVEPPCHSISMLTIGCRKDDAKLLVRLMASRCSVVAYCVLRVSNIHGMVMTTITTGMRRGIQNITEINGITGANVDSLRCSNTSRPLASGTKRPAVLVEIPAFSRRQVRNESPVT